mmetsp:Transcript_51408/g.164585  ORF Transcript_51408/g.164585 Transcript_51408/m.164585 type:complete len:209 (-) Transcript_51408:1229-1855(-)
MLELLAAGEHLEEQLLVAALPAAGHPMLPQALGPVAEESFGFEACVAQLVMPRPHNVHLRTVWTECRINEARQTVVTEEGVHVVPVASSSQESRGNLATVRCVVQEAHVVGACGDKSLQLPPRRWVHFVVGAVCQHHRDALGEAPATWVRVDEKCRASPVAHLPERNDVHPPLGSGCHKVRLKPVDIRHDRSQVRRHVEMGLLGVGNA